jgi:predicted nicotinamide N-methyase
MTERHIFEMTEQSPSSTSQLDCNPYSSTEISHSVDLPKRAHPTAKAFFDALDKQQLQHQANKSERSSSPSVENSSPQPQRPMSAALQKKLQTVGWRNRLSQEDYYPLHIGDFDFSVHQVQRGEVEGTYGTGATVWPAALVLMKFLERHAEMLVKGRHVIDLGSGTGVTSIAAALLGAAFVACTDGEEAVVQLERDNIGHAAHELQAKRAEETGKVDDNDGQSNIVASIAGCPVAVQKYWWGTDKAPKMISSNGCDLILVADCVLPKLYPIAPLVQAIDECLATPSNTVGMEINTQSSLSLLLQQPCAVLSYEHRYYPDYDPRERFRELAAERNLHVYNVPMKDMDPIYSVEDIEIWLVTRGV